MKFSIVIPTYNSEKFLARCLEQLVNQTYQNIEIIIIDDGSTDNTAEVYNKYKALDKRIVVKKQKNGGVSVASNNGIKMATGDYVHIHDHDDYVNIEYFERMADAIEITKKTGLPDILCGEVNQPEYDFPRFDYVESCTLMQDKFIKTRANHLNPAWRYVYKKSFLRDIKLEFNKDFWGDQDVIFTRTAVIKAQKITMVPEAIYNVVNVMTSLGKTKPKIIPEDVLKRKSSAWQNFWNMADEYGATKYLKEPMRPTFTQSLKIFNIRIAHINYYGHKKRYYIFGINIATTRQSA